MKYIKILSVLSFLFVLPSSATKSQSDLSRVKKYLGYYWQTEEIIIYKGNSKIELAELFHKNPKATTLVFLDSDLSELPELFVNCNHIIYILIVNHNITKLNGLLNQLSKKSNITGITLTDMDINQLPSAISNFSNLDYLELENLGELQIDIHLPKNLKQLFVESCNWTYFSPTNNDLKVSTLAISIKNMERLPENLQLLSEVVELSIGASYDSVNAYNEFDFTSIEQFSNSSKLNKFYFVGFDLKQKGIPKSIFKLKNVKMLGLSTNKLQFLDPDLFKMDSLESIDLNFNELVDLPVGIFKMKNISSLSFQDNKINNCNFIKDKEIKQNIGLDLLNNQLSQECKDTLKNIFKWTAL